jgi:hypothetical protein
MSNYINRDGLHLTFRDGLNFGCGLWVSFLVFWIGMSLIFACLAGVLTVLGIGGLEALQ